MTRQLEQKTEERQLQRQGAITRALDYGLAGALESNGDELVGFLMTYEPHSCLMTLKGLVDGSRQVCFVGSDNMANCVLKAVSDARNHRLKWRSDKYHQK